MSSFEKPKLLRHFMEGTPCRPCWIDTEGHRLFCLLVLIFGLSLWSVFLHCLKVEFLMRRIILFILGLGFAVFVLLPTVHHEVAEFRCWGFYVVFLWFFFQAVDEEQAVCVRAAFVCYAWLIGWANGVSPTCSRGARLSSEQPISEVCWRNTKLLRNAAFLEMLPCLWVF